MCVRRGADCGCSCNLPLAALLLLLLLLLLALPTVGREGRAAGRKAADGAML